MYQIIKRLKNSLYFPVASYFRFWAKIKLRRWRPKIVVITGSNGKTFLLSLFRHQLEDKACYTLKANSAFGIPFYLLNIRRQNYLLWEWIVFFFQAPLAAWGKVPTQNLLFVEADCDREGEGKFLASFLKPHITLWQNVSLTHSANFSPGVLEKIAYEFGYFLKYSQDYILVNKDCAPIIKQIPRTKAKVVGIEKKDLKNYQVSLKGTDFVSTKGTYHLDYILPKDSYYALCMLKQTLLLLNQPFKNNFSALHIEAGRSTLFRGIKETVIIDSTYNSNFSSTKAMIETFSLLSSPHRWLIIGDMIDLGEKEKSEHETLAQILQDSEFEKLILIGKRNITYTLPRLHKKNVVGFLQPGEALNYILKNLRGNELILIKGAGFLEGIVEKLLKNPQDRNLLCRREKIWEERRRQFYL